MINQTHKLIHIVMLACFLLMSAATVAAEQSPKEGVINLNTATVTELSYLPGVGPSKAQAIIKYREKQPFKKVEHIMRVKGIGRKSFKKMRPFLTLNGDTTVKKKIVIKQ